MNRRTGTIRIKATLLRPAEPKNATCAFLVLPRANIWNPDAPDSPESSGE